MEAGYSYVVEARDACVESLGGDGGFFGDGDVAGSGAEDGDVAAGLGGGLAESEGAGGFAVGCGGMRCEDESRGGGVDASGEDVDAGGGERGEDFQGLLRGFVGGVDDFGETAAEGAVVIDAGVAEVFEGERLEARGGVGGSEVALFDGGEESEECGLSHTCVCGAASGR